MQPNEDLDMDEHQRHVELENVKDDPRVDRDGYKMVKAKGGGRNTESFDPKSTLVRPEMRILVGPNRETLDRRIKHDDVIIVPEFFCKEDDWSLYYKLVEEMRAAQADGLNKSEWISWHEGAHLISMNPTGSPTFNAIQEKISKYFGICNNRVGTRFNWYKDGTDWKPFHHDSAAFNPQRARNQNITVGVSFGASRELSFLHTKNGSRIYFPQTNGMLFSFGRDVNINWKHGINALSDEEIVAGGTNSLGRISIVLWGNCPLALEEDGSPGLLADNTRGFGHSIHSHSNSRDFDRPFNPRNDDQFNPHLNDRQQQFSGPNDRQQQFNGPNDRQFTPRDDRPFNSRTNDRQQQFNGPNDRQQQFNGPNDRQFAPRENRSFNSRPNDHRQQQFNGPNDRQFNPRDDRPFIPRNDGQFNSRPNDRQQQFNGLNDRQFAPRENRSFNPRPNDRQQQFNPRDNWADSRDGQINQPDQQQVIFDNRLPRDNFVPRDGSQFSGDRRSMDRDSVDRRDGGHRGVKRSFDGPSVMPVCRNYSAEGSCRYGDRCKFQHTD